MKKTTGLGRGLGSLIPDKKSEKVVPVLDSDQLGGVSVSEIAVVDIVENPRQPRTNFSPSHLEDLIASVKEYGIIQPLVVTRVKNGYELIAGERRFRAAKAVGLEAVPVVVREATEQEKLELALIENIQRHDLNAVEEALAYRSLMSSFDMTQEDVARKLGKSRSSIANTMRLLDLNEEMLEALTAGEITRSHARALLAQADPAVRHQMFLQMLSGEMTVREAEQMGSKKRVNSPRKEKDPNVVASERELETVFGTKVRIDKKSNGQGKITIDFYSEEELFSLVTQLSSGE